MLEDLLEELVKESEDEDFDSSELLEKIEDELKKLNDGALIDVLDGLSENVIELIQSVLQNLAEVSDVVEDYLM